MVFEHPLTICLILETPLSINMTHLQLSYVNESVKDFFLVREDSAQQCSTVNILYILCQGCIQDFFLGENCRILL